MAKQSDTFDEMDRLRDEVRQTEEMGREIADRLTDERAKNAALAAELERLRYSGGNNGSGQDWKWLSIPPNKIMAVCLCFGFVAMVMSTFIAKYGAKDESEFVTLVVSRTVTQALFLAWCISIFKRDRILGLIKRLSIWALAWGSSIIYIASKSPGSPDLEVGLIVAAMPANWWMLPFAISGREEMVWLAYLMAGDITTDFSGSRMVLGKLLQMLERLKGAIR